MNIIGKRLSAARAEAGISQMQLARRAGVAQAAISRIERGDTTDPGIIVVAGLARALGLSLDRLVAGALRTRRRQRRRMRSGISRRSDNGASDGTSAS